MKIASLLTLLLSFTTSLFADASPAMDAGRQQIYQTGTMIAIGVIFFYFMIYRPQQRERKALQELQGSLSKGSHVTTIGGLVGTVDEILENTLIIKSADSKFEVLKAAITPQRPAPQKN